MGTASWTARRAHMVNRKRTGVGAKVAPSAGTATRNKDDRISLAPTRRAAKVTVFVESQNHGKTFCLDSNSSAVTVRDRQVREGHQHVSHPHPHSF